MRKSIIPQPMTVEYFLGDHLGSTSLTTDSAGTKVSEIKYKPWGEVRSAWTATQTTTPAYELARYTFTGQYSYMDDPTTSGTTEGFGLMFYNARWYDPSLGRFAQADTIVPGGVQGFDRYAYVNNNPIMYIDPSGHLSEKEWERLYGKDAWLEFKNTLSKEMFAFLTSDAFEYGNIVSLQFGENAPIYLFIGENSNGQGISFYDIKGKTVYSGNAVLLSLQMATKWGVLQRQEGNGGYFSGGYEPASSNDCPTCDNSIMNSNDFPEDWWKNLAADNFVNGENGFIYIKTEVDTARAIKAQIEYFGIFFTIGTGCVKGYSCVPALYGGYNLLWDSMDDFDAAIIDQRPLIVQMAN